MPPQGSTHGATGPTPRQVPGLTWGAGVSGAWPAFETCAPSLGATLKIPTIASAVNNANLDRISSASLVMSRNCNFTNSGLRNHVKHQDLRLLRAFRRSTDIVLMELRNEAGIPRARYGRNVRKNLVMVRVLLLDHRDGADGAVQISARNVQAVQRGIISQIVNGVGCRKAGDLFPGVSIHNHQPGRLARGHK